MSIGRKLDDPPPPQRNHTKDCWAITSPTTSAFSIALPLNSTMARRSAEKMR